jgi:hypothetical protein
MGFVGIDFVTHGLPRVKARPLNFDFDLNFDIFDRVDSDLCHTFHESAFW